MSAAAVRRPNGAMRRRKCKMPGEVWRAGCAILARHPQELQGTDWRRPRARATQAGIVSRSAVDGIRTNGTRLPPPPPRGRSQARFVRPSASVRARQMKPLITDNDHVPKESCGSGRRGRNEGEMVVRRPVACGIEIGMRRRPPVWNLRRLQFICDVDIRPIQRNVHHDTGYTRNTGYPHNLREIRQ